MISSPFCGNRARIVIQAFGKKAFGHGADRIHRQVLPQFLLLSFALHLFFLMGLGKSENIMPERRLGQPVLEVQLQSTSRTHASRPASKVDQSPVKVASDSRASSEVTEYAPDTVPAIPHTPESTTPDKQPSRENTEAAIHNQLLGDLQTRLSHYLTYPPLARSRGWEGTVLLGLRVESNGRLKKIRIARSSGYAVLDNSALNSLNRLGQLAEASAWLNGRGLDMQLPVIYRLIEN